MYTILCMWLKEIKSIYENVVEITCNEYSLSHACIAIEKETQTVYMIVLYSQI